MSDHSLSLQQQVKENIKRGQAMQIRAGGSKDFYAQAIEGEALSVLEHSGIVNYEPTELVITARCGTPLHEIESELEGQDQMLAFEPPAFSQQSTLGGCIATGLSGPRRAFAGAVRDATLGTKIINGEGDILKFGGEVMKNVAGYDISRLMVGSMGTLGIILEASLKVLPIPETEVTTCFELTERASINRINKFYVQALPISATCYDGKQLFVRLSGTAAGVNSALHKIGGDRLDDADSFWRDLKNHRHPFFYTKKRLWRISLSPATPPLEITGEQLIEWRGAQRWLASDQDPAEIRKIIDQHGGHATVFNNKHEDDAVFHPISGKLHELHMNLKLAMDPHCLFNPNRMYQGF